jgi:aspartyl-tRNA(Asn)/glutamyl-tRNA(Gln) amidotransferase subunit A
VLSDDVYFSSITELAAELRAGRVSPIELAEGYLGRLERIGPRLGAVASLMRESALKEAREAERELRAGHDRGPLHGIPYGVKDVFATRDANTTWGAAPYKDQRFDHDAAVIRRLREAGAVLVAKLSMIELAGGLGYNQADASLTGACRTPWNTEFWSGGSSSGSGAAVAAGLVAFAIGSDTAGSITTPAAFCGVTGLRPTHGSVSRSGCMPLSWTVDTIGPLCRTASDCKLVLSAITSSSTSTSTSTSTMGPIRVAVLQGCYEKAQPEVRENFLRTVEVFKQKEPHAHVEMDVPLPDFPYHAAIRTIVHSEAASAFRALIESGRVRELAAPEARVRGCAASLITAVDYLHAMRVRARARRAWAKMFEAYDVLLAPSRPTVAFPVNTPFDQAYPRIAARSPTFATSLAGVPSLSIPNGFGGENLPTGAQLIGPPGSEARLIELADRFQRETDWHRRRPPII